MVRHHLQRDAGVGAVAGCANALSVSPGNRPVPAAIAAAGSVVAAHHRPVRNRRRRSRRKPAAKTKFRSWRRAFRLGPCLTPRSSNFLPPLRFHLQRRAARFTRGIAPGSSDFYPLNTRSVSTQAHCWHSCRCCVTEFLKQLSFAQMSLIQIKNRRRWHGGALMLLAALALAGCKGFTTHGEREPVNRRAR